MFLSAAYYYPGLSTATLIECSSIQGMSSYIPGTYLLHQSWVESGKCSNGSNHIHNSDKEEDEEELRKERMKRRRKGRRWR